MALEGKENMAASPQRRTKSKSKAAAKISPRSGGHRPLPPKLSPPRPGRLYPRERLFNLLDKTRQNHRVVWVSAPGGAGKTSLATSYLSARKLPIFWYQVDRGDGDIASVFYYMSLAARRAAPRHRKPLPVLTPEYLADIPTFTRNYFRELYRRMPKGTVIVLDNYQDAPEKSLLHDVIHTAMSEIPEGVNLFVLSRMEPPAVLARLRLCDHAACLDWKKLQLTPEETAGLGGLRAGGQTLDLKTVDILQRRTSGWAAGVVLMLEQADILSGYNLTQPPNDQELLFDYFAGEVLHRCQADIQDFLLKTALFPKVTAAQAQALTDNTKARDILEDLTRRNYFTVRHIAPEDIYYEYHPLFREFLLARGGKQFPPEQIMNLKRLAGRMLVDGGNIEAAVSLLAQAADWQSLIPIVLQNAPQVARQGRLQTLNDWLTLIPGALRDAEPWVLYWFGVCTFGKSPREASAFHNAAYELFVRRNDALGAMLAWAGAVNAISFDAQDFGELDPWLTRLSYLTKTYPEAPSIEVDVEVTAAALIAIMWRTPAHPSAAYWTQRALNLLRNCPDARPRALLAFYRHVSSMWYSVSATSEIKEIEELAAGLIPRLDDAPFEQILCYHVQNWSGLNRVDPDVVLDSTSKALAVADRSGVHVMDFMVLGSAACACLAVGDLTRADELIARMQKAQSAHSKLDASFFWYVRAWRAALGGELELARDWMTRAVDLDRELKGLPVYTLSVLARAEYQIALGELAGVRAALLEAEELLQGTSIGIIRLSYRLVETQLAFAEGNEERGFDKLREWLGLCRRVGLLCVIGNLGESAARLCVRALTHGIEVETARAIIHRRRLSPVDGTLSEHWPWPLRLYTFGDFRIIKYDSPLDTENKGSRKPLELLKTLITFGGRNVPEDQLSATLWPDTDGDAARLNLKVNIHRLRKLLPEDAVMWSEGKLSLNASRVWVDLWTLERELTHLDQLSAVSFRLESLSILDRVFNLYRGGFLLENNAPWVLAMRERLRNKILRIVTRVAESLSQHDSVEAIPLYEKAIDLDPLREALYQGLIRCYLKLQQPAEGLRIYRHCRDMLKRELGVPPSMATEALYQALKSSIDLSGKS